MKNTITPKLTIILSLSLLIWSGAALAQTEEQIKAFNKERESYFNENLKLTEAEKLAFWPMYNDFHNRKMKILEEERNAFRYSHHNSENLSDKEINETLARIRDLKEKNFQLEQEYYKERFPKVLPPKKVMKLYKVEWDYRRHLVGRLKGEGHGPGEGRGRQGKGMQSKPPMDPPPGY
ncbi:MAG: hypothetical protein GY790_02930 [Bacteroidetes bacterium]|nr:hypothetical protein [Bacteroidota bacterium]